MVSEKLAAAGNQPVKIGPGILKKLRVQSRTLLQPVLRPEDFESFDLDRAYGVIEALARRLS